MALIDIILPNHQSNLYPAIAIESILNQTFQDFQIILIQDHITNPFIQKYSNSKKITIIKNKGKGLVEALNTGLKFSQSEWVCRMDSDDIMHPRRLELQLKSARQSDASFISCQVKNFGENLQKGYKKYVDWHNKLLNSKDIKYSRFIECPVIHPTWFLKRSLFEKYGYYSDDGVPEDYEFFLRICSHTHFFKINKVLHFWRDYPGRTSRIDTNYSFKKFLKIKVKYFLKYFKKPLGILSCGKGGKYLAKELITQGHKPKFFLEIDPKKIGRAPYGIPVFDRTDYKLKGQGVYLLNALMSPDMRQDIEKWCDRHELEYEKDYIHFN